MKENKKPGSRKTARGKAATKGKEATTDKAAKGKAAKGKTSNLPPSEFVLGDREESFGASLVSDLERIYRRSKRTMVGVSQDEVIRNYMPINDFLLQWIIDSRGIEKKTFFEVIGRDSTGKTSLLYSLAGPWISQGSPLLVLSCEDKFLKRDWAARCMTRNPLLAEKLLPEIAIFRPRTLGEIAFQVRNAIKLTRDPESKYFIPTHIPLTIIIDPINKPATKSEAGGSNILFGDMSKADTTELGDRGHNWDRAKEMQDLIRRINLETPDANLIVLLGSHLNDDAAGKVKTNPFASEAQRDVAHRTKSGGQASNQTVALQVIVSYNGRIYCEGRPIADRILMKPFKNSYGTNYRSGCYAIMKEEIPEEFGQLPPALSWDLTTVEWMATEGIWGLKRVPSAPATAPTFSSDDLGITQVNILEAARALRAQPAERWEDLGRKLRIAGYVDVIQEAVDAVNQSNSSGGGQT